MFSAYLFLAFIFGRTLLVESTPTDATLEQLPDDTTTTKIAFKANVDLAATDEVYVVTKDGTVANDEIQKITLTATVTAGAKIETTGSLASGTQFDFYPKQVSASKEVSVAAYTFATKPDKPAVDFKTGDATSATLEWTNFDIYDSTSSKLGSDALTVTSKDIDISKPSTFYDFLFKGTKHGLDSEDLSLKICTAPTKPTVTHEIKSDGAATPVYTLNLKMAFAAEDSVSEIVIDFGVDVTKPSSCDQSDCEDCKGCTTEDGSSNKQFKLKTADTDKGATYAVIISNYPDANLHSDFKVTAKFNNAGNCVAANLGEVVYDLKSVASLAKQEALLVYLAIGTMIAVLRMFGLDVWSPLGSH